MTFTAYLNGERPEVIPEISWFDVQRIYSTCAAKWKFEEKKEQEPAKFADHVAILNPETFNSLFIREPIADDYEEILCTDAQLKDWLKSRGISGYSAKKYDELVEMIDLTSERPFILKREQEKIADIAYQQRLTVIPGNEWDRILAMRSVFFGNKSFADMLTDTYNDVLLVGELCGVPVRLKYDAISRTGSIIDYVSATSSGPEDFRNQAERGGYYIKQAMLHDAFVSAYNCKPERQMIIVQETKSPYIPVAYGITEQHIQIGRIQYQSALKMLKACMESESWASYSAPGEIIDLPISPWFKKQYGIED